MSSTPTPTPSPETDQVGGEAVLLSFALYIGIFAVLVLVYTVLRSRLPKLYQPRKYIAQLQCLLSSRDYPKFGQWIPGAFKITDDELFVDAGLDSVAFIRLLRMGTKVALVSCLNAIYLIPVYKYMGEETSAEDELARWSLGHLPTGSAAMWATLIASYIIFPSTLYLIYKEFSWYLRKRHEFMSRDVVSNYAVFIRCIPEALRSNERLREYLECISPGQIADVRVALDVDELEKQVEQREEVVPALEHAYNVLQCKGVRQESRVSLCSKEKVDSITKLETELALLNDSISKTIEEAEEFQEAADEGEPQKGFEISDVSRLVPLIPLNKLTSRKSFRVRSAAFVTYRSLQSTMAALQMLLHEEPFKLCPEPTPIPEQVYWSNVGMPHLHQQLGLLVSLSATIALCIFWTIPVAFVASISKVSFLKQELPFLADAAEAWPPMDILLQQISPIALSILNALLPVFLLIFSKWEGHISLATLNASLFGKLALFYIIQTFFVSAIASSLLASLKDLTESPLETIQTILATNLPQQSNYFISFVFVQIGLDLGLELIRVVPAATALLRRWLGPNLSEKERSRPWLGLSPLSAPKVLESPKLVSTVMLFFMILFVYSVMSPITSFVMAFAFFSFAIVYKIEYACVYDPSEDTGGQLWSRAIRFIIACSIIAEFTVLAVLAIKGGAVVSPLMFPLFIGTILFWIYLEQRHFLAAAYLPAKSCASIDKERQSLGFNSEAWQGCYNPTAMRYKSIEPDVSEDIRELPGDDIKSIEEGKLTPNRAASQGAVVSPGEPTTIGSATIDDKIQKEIYDARSALHDFHNGTSKLTDEELWKARKLKESAIHPDTGEMIPQPFRMSGYVPFNGPVCVGAVMAKSTPAIIFWHWINQSQNAFVNYFNRNASSPVDDATLTKSYLAAVTSAIAIAYGLSTVVKKRLPPARATVVLRWVGLPASMVASSANCFIMRHSELDTGITVFKKGTNEEVGTSRLAAKKALKEVVASRVLLQFPVFGVSPAFMTLPPIQKMCMAYPSLALPISTTVLLLSFGFGLPASIAAFPQTGIISEESLEPELQGHGDLEYNKGL
ncbi:hypothetical protein FOL47_007476 [Perkinsus chesapeaki]|uniref:Uncharacterized protein n=1 Tax=Perkinsus chesapeaki TaxID=330153 RepID=A0A7J6LKY4_PERCH|nr:hypothetical protein FOL47_007476 [Perkinsus chesapeaki]